MTSYMFTFYKHLVTTCILYNFVVESHKKCKMVNFMFMNNHSNNLTKIDTLLLAAFLSVTHSEFESNSYKNILRKWY